MPELTLVIPAPEHLDSYVTALETGWSPDNMRGRAAIAEQLSEIRADPAAFLGSMDDPQGRGAPVPLPDGGFASRLPSIVRWIWDGEFGGRVSLRWQAGTGELPAHVLGHIGFTVPTWKQRRGYAVFGLGCMLEEAKRRGLPFVDLTTTPDNIASQAVITRTGGRLVERFALPAGYGNSDALRFRIDL